MPSGWCEEWWLSSQKSDKFDSTDETLDLHRLEYDYIPATEAFKLSEEYDIPLHPKYLLLL